MQTQNASHDRIRPLYSSEVNSEVARSKTGWASAEFLIGGLPRELRVDTIPVPETTTFTSYAAHLQAPIDPVTGDAATSATIRFYVDGISSDVDVNLFVDNAHFGLGTPV